MKYRIAMGHRTDMDQKPKKRLHTALALLLAAALCLCACSGAAENAPADAASAVNTPDKSDPGGSTPAADAPESSGPAASDGVKTVDLMAGIKAQETETRKVDVAFRKSQYEYSLNILKACVDTGGEGTLMVSPLSLELVLAMAANGAEGETLEQLLQLFGASSLQELNETLHGFIEGTGKECTTSNSVWLRDGAADPKQEFLQTAADFYSAEIFRAAFDEGTVSDINNWAKEKTKGMIDRIIDQIGPNDLVYLLNAVCFEAKWEVPYQDSDVLTGKFLTQDGSEQPVDMMFSTEYCYFSDDHAQGFMKDYEGGRYKFAAIRPNDGIDVFDYLEELDGSALLAMLTDSQYEEVLTKIPEFKTERDLDLAAALRQLGVTAPFTKAEFPGIGADSSVTGIRQKTFIEVDREGTRAAAVTGMTTASAVEETRQPHTVYLDRPFIYLILDGSSRLPVFMGIVTDPIADCGMPD